MDGNQLWDSRAYKEGQNNQQVALGRHLKIKQSSWRKWTKRDADFRKF
jgi:hypothetical protein